MKKTWLLKISFDEHDTSPNEVKSLYHNKTEEQMVKDMDIFQDMNKHIILVLTEVGKKSSHDKIIEIKNPRMIFMDSKFNWNGKWKAVDKSYEDLKEEYLEETILESLKSGKMGVS